MLNYILTELRKSKEFASLFKALLRGYLLVIVCRIKYGKRVSFGRNFRVYGSGAVIKLSLSGISTIVIGDNCVLNNSTKFNSVGVLKPCSIVAHRGLIRIGNNVGMSGVSLFSDNSIIISDFCTIGANVFIFDTDFHSLDPCMRIGDHDKGFVDGAVCAPIYIGKNVFIGLNSIVLKGSLIGDESVLGAGFVGSVKCHARSIVVSASNRVIPMTKFN